MKIKAILQEGNKPNKNNRIYPPELLKREADKYKELYVKENRALVTQNATFNLKEVVGQVKDISMEGDKLVIEVEMLNVPGAKEMWQLLEEGKMFLRMSGIGSMTRQEDGNYVMNNDYQLENIFFTDNPA
jgi:hypothetical protein